MSPRKSLRTRLTLQYAALFFACAVVLVGATYFLVRHNVGPVRAIVSDASGELSLLPQRRVDHDAWRRTLAQLSLLTGLLIAVSVAFGWLLAGRALRPMGEILRVAREVSDANLRVRIGFKGSGNELTQLASAIDAMLERVDAIVSTQRRFIADASHELRTPLAVMRTGIDVSLTDPEASEEERQQATRDLAESVARSEALIQSLLALARSEQASEERVEVDLAEIAAQTLAEVTESIDDRRLELTTKFSPALVRGDPPLLRTLVANLLRNAVLYNRPRGSLSLRVEETAGEAVIVVSNTGDVVLEEEVEGLFEPFRRSRASRSTGSGLGLAIVKSVAEAHHGMVAARAHNSGGLEVVVSLPRADTSSDESQPDGTAPRRRRGRRLFAFAFLVLAGLSTGAAYAAFSGAIAIAHVSIVRASDAQAERAAVAFPLVWSGMSEANVRRVAGNPTWVGPSRVCPVQLANGTALTPCWPGQQCLEYGDVESEQSIEFCFQGGLSRKKWFVGRAWDAIVAH